MKLCDRCFHNGDHRPGPHSITIGFEEFDVCDSCREKVKDFISSPEKKVSVDSPSESQADGKKKRTYKKSAKKPKSD